MTRWKELTKHWFRDRDNPRHLQGLVSKVKGHKIHQELCKRLAEHNVVAKNPIQIPTFEQFCDYLFLLDGNNLKYMMLGLPYPFYWNAEKHVVTITEYSETVHLTGGIKA